MVLCDTICCVFVALVLRDLGRNSNEEVRISSDLLGALRCLERMRQFTLCGERFYAGMPFTAPNGETVRVWVEVSNARLNPEDLANDGILDLVFGTFEASK